ncbi:MAG TPA: sodium:proton antiporter [Erythrobacter sp.]|jgi:NhaP-type Na+/H+ or K+/H+ antiporter|uniref:NhaP-type Na+/H+ or K+/H+ antiporter n=1 Tax=Qipengyuania citrea TaxID=225971 RepID=A0A6I4UB28_9SPHN|nr:MULTISPECIES: sodium:proton antiporter [Erythrobacteraceae]MAQ29997.1 sodium:proton antiporter [Erythrobacter sp.]MBN90421.1 sodium:proton antiporter [Erythrobacteraceae bacterium]MCZ4264262.1 sodium:proton antiporter [Erythrobacter sp. G21629-S1]KZX95222.1 sodium:proton antiporter [Erythrobacter sp. HI0019]KZY00708.1 sodium:proton antiporter [Erythrobacter sp. HI0028]|tara:strand:- start:479 stop:2332 length:1854 start_codon:yes stop_codon:yes gene_type:complete
MEQSLVIAMVGMLGIGAQWLAWRTGWPAIVLMLAAGFLAGPVLGLFDPEHAFGDLLDPMIAIGVALILFEGGLSLDFRELRHAGEGVWRLVLLGGPIAWVLGAFAAHSIGGLEWPVAILFAGILVVTGPTVVMPLLRQSSVKARPAAILKWEAIVNDPIGALFAVVSYEYFRAVTESPGASLFEVVPPLIIAAIIAGLIGYVAAAAIAWAFPRGAIPEYLKVPVLLTSVIVVFVLSNQIEHEAGLVAVTVMGIALANMNVSSLRSIHPFKQNIAVILIAGIFVLLSASLEFEELAYLNWNFGLFLLALLFLVRPATILLSLLGSSVPWNERLFLSWIAPRGIVLVAISGLFALRLEDIGYDGTALIGLSFAVVVATIVAHGFTIDLVARLLNLKGSNRPGVLIVGSTPWTISLALMMQELKAPVMVVDSSWQRLALARQKGLPFYHGEILNEATEHNLDLTPYSVLVAATENEAYNALVCNEFAYEIGRDTVFQLGDAIDDEDRHALPSGIRGRALFESGFGVEDVNERLARGWVFRKTKLSEEFTFAAAQDRLPDAAAMLLLVRDNGTLRFFTHAARPEPRAGDVIVSFAPPQERSAQDAAAKRDRKRNKTAEQGA